jgi:hypothetical protein
MEALNNNLPVLLHQDAGTNNKPLRSTSFIEANTIESSLREIRDRHIIPVFIKDNEPLISHADFVEIMQEMAADFFEGEAVGNPDIRLSHPIKGRIPDAKDKPASQLEEHEKTLYYERMAFIIELPGIVDTVEGNTLSLTVGGVKAYNQDNLYAKKGTDEHFKIFIGFKNTVCTNLCIWTDGYMSDLKVSTANQLRACIRSLFENYNAGYQLFHLKKLGQYSLTESQFAHLVGRCRMFPHLPKSMQAGLQPIQLGDAQMNAIVRDYYRDDSFCKMDSGDINLWRLYNLFTGANKSSYIDSFLDRSVNAFTFSEQIRRALDEKAQNWFIN